MWRAVCVLTAALVLASVQAQADVGDYLGKPIVSLTIRSEGRTLEETRLVALIETTVGRPLTMRAVRESVTHLFSLALFEDVRVLAAPSSLGVALTYELIPLHPVESLEFVGAVSGIDTGRMRRGLVERYGSSPRAARSNEMTADVEQMLRGVGYLGAHVTVKAQIQHDPERTTLTFALEPGVIACGKRRVRDRADADLDIALRSCQFGHEFGVRRGNVRDRRSACQHQHCNAGSHRRVGRTESAGGPIYSCAYAMHGNCGFASA